jgi:hypothetical protein
LLWLRLSYLLDQNTEAESCSIVMLLYRDGAARSGKLLHHDRASYYSIVIMSVVMLLLDDEAAP